MRLFIAEKPSVGLEIAKALGGAMSRADGFVRVGTDDVVTWCVGHLLSQATPEAYGNQYQKWDVSVLPIVPNKWIMIPNTKTIKQLHAIEALLKNTQIVVNCGDSAREGQLIIDELLSYFNYHGPAKRLWLQEMNLLAIKKGLSNMRDNEEYDKLYTCALARSRADWIMGMNLTRGYTTAWRSKGNRGTLHVGRVQTPTLCLIVARDIEIENFKSKNFYILKADVQHTNGKFKTTWQTPKNLKVLDCDGHITEKKFLEQIITRIKGKEGLITSCDTKPKTQSPPLPFSLGELQKTCNKLLGLSPSQTLNIAQSLYEKHKLTTYPRTDFSHLPENEHRLSERIINCVKCNYGQSWDFLGTPDFTLRSTARNSSKIGDHHGLRPTMVKDYDLKQLSKTEYIVYHLIVRNFLAQFYSSYKYDSTIVEVFCESEIFRATGSVETNSGWKLLFKLAGNEAKEEEFQTLPKMSSGDACTISDAQIEGKKTSPPPHFDGASIIDAMEKAYLYVTDAKVKIHLKETGIGTPATRAAIVDNLIDREYITESKEGKRKIYLSTSRGRLLYKSVPDQLRKPDLTAYFEELLKAVERGELNIDRFMDHQIKFVEKLIIDIKSGKIAQAMPRLEEFEPIKTIKSSKPLYGVEKQNIQIENIPQNKSTLNIDNDKKFCPQCNSSMRIRKGSQGSFWGCSGFPGCKHTEPI
jgi:DNA topoisomerase-3